MAYYHYDALGRRVSKVFPAGSQYGASQLYVNDDRRRVLEMYKGQWTTPYFRWVDGAGIDEHLLVESDVDGDGFKDSERDYVCTDNLGSRIVVVSQTGAVGSALNYDPYGRPQTASPEEGYLYTGRRYDPETGFYYYRGRIYGPVLGRFLSPDPMANKLSDIGQLRDMFGTYCYVLCRPTTLVDPTGQEVVLGYVEYHMWLRQQEIAKEQQREDVLRPVGPLSEGWQDEPYEELAPIYYEDVQEKVTELENAIVHFDKLLVGMHQGKLDLIDFPITTTMQQRRSIWADAAGKLGLKPLDTVASSLGYINPTIQEEWYKTMAKKYEGELYRTWIRDWAFKKAFAFAAASGTGLATGGLACGIAGPIMGPIAFWKMFRRTHNRIAWSELIRLERNRAVEFLEELKSFRAFCPHRPRGSASASASADAGIGASATICVAGPNDPDCNGHQKGNE